MKYSVVNYIDHTKEYFYEIDPLQSETIKTGNKIIRNIGNSKTEEYMIYGVKEHHYIKDLIIVYVEPYKDIEMQKKYRQSMINQQFYDFNLDSHIRGCMGIAMDQVNHDSRRYYERIHYLQGLNDIKDLLIQALTEKDKQKQIWIWAAIGELKNIKNIIDGMGDKL